MAVRTEVISIGVPPQVRPILDGLAGETPDQKITYLLRDAIQRNLEACEIEQLGFEIKYGLEYQDFRRQLEAGELGDQFGYGLETDAMRWDDLVAEKWHWLQQLNLLRTLS